MLKVQVKSVSAAARAGDHQRIQGRRPLPNLRSPGHPGGRRGLPRRPLRGHEPVRHPREASDHHAPGHAAGPAHPRGAGLTTDPNTLWEYCLSAVCCVMVFRILAPPPASAVFLNTAAGTIPEPALRAIPIPPLVALFNAARTAA